MYIQYLKTNIYNVDECTDTRIIIYKHFYTILLSLLIYKDVKNGSFCKLTAVRPKTIF